MGTPLAIFTNGNAMAAADVNNALTASRDYLNSGIVTADFEASGIRLEQLYRPDIYAVPRPWFDGEFQQAMDDRHGQEPGELPLSLNGPAVDFDRGRGFGEVRDRSSIHPTLGLLAGGWSPTETAVRVYVDVASRVRLTAQWWAMTVVNSTTPPIVCGFFDLRWRKVEEGADLTPAVFTGTRRQVLYDEAGHAYSAIADLDVQAGDEGTYDFGLCFSDSGVGALAFQIAICQSNLVVEVLKRG